MNAPRNRELHIFLDIDGVIADFDTHATAQGKVKAGGKLDYDALDLKWWVTMPAFAQAKPFFDALKALGTVKFLTGPMVSPDCFGGKAQWVMNFVPERGKWALKDLIICPSDDKAYLARANHVLIDDRKTNIDAWEKAGGLGIHHTGDFQATLARVKAMMAEHGLVPPPPPASRAAKKSFGQAPRT